MATKEWDPTKPHLYKVAPLDTAAIDAEAAEWVRGHMAKAKDRETRLKSAVVVADAEADLEAINRVRRDRVALSIEAHYNVRRGAALHEAIGVGRTRWNVMRDEAADQRHPKVANAPAKLEELAASTYRARQRAHYAREARDEIVRELAAEGWPTVRIAELIGRHPSQVSHIKFPDGARPKVA